MTAEEDRGRFSTEIPLQLSINRPIRTSIASILLVLRYLNYVVIIRRRVIFQLSVLLIVAFAHHNLGKRIY